MTIVRADGKVIPLDAYNLVDGAIGRSRTLADTWTAQATYAFADLSNFHIEPYNFTVNYNVADWLPQYVRPSRPVTPSLAPIITATPNLPTLDPIAVTLMGAAPAEPDFGNLLVYNAPTAPNTPIPVAPSDVTPALDVITVPSAPVYALPDVPTLYSLSLPAVPNIVLPTFDGIRPTFNLAMPIDGDLAYTEKKYTSVLKDEMTAQIRNMIQGNYGLPLAIEQALFDRGRSREDRLSHKQIMEVTEDMAARGLSEPNGILGKRLQQARESNREAVHGLNRDLTIERAKEALDGMKFAIGQGMALEQVLIQENIALNDRALKIAIYVRDYSIARLNAQISYANLQQQAYATDAQVWRQRIDGALAVLEIYKSQIEGQRLIGEINKTLVDRYEAQFRAISIMADIYKTNVEASKTRSEINVQRIEAAKLKLEQYDITVNAWGKLQDGYKTQIEASLGSVRFAETLASIYSTRMAGYKIKGESIARDGEFQIARNTQSITLFQAALQREEQSLKGQTAQLEAALKVFAGQTQLYEADGSIAQAESAALDRSASLKIENEKNRTSVALAQGEDARQQMLKIAELMLEQLKAKALNITQLLASSQSGVNFGASFSGSSGNSYGYSQGVGWSGSANDYTGPTSF